MRWTEVQLIGLNSLDSLSHHLMHPSLMDYVQSTWQDAREPIVSEIRTQSFRAPHLVMPKGLGGGPMDVCLALKEQQGFSECKGKGRALLASSTVIQGTKR